MENQIAIYKDESNAIQLEVKMDGDMLWLTRGQLATLFGRDYKTISKHINNALKEELADEVVVAKFANTTQHGAIEGKTQTREVEIAESRTEEKELGIHAHSLNSDPIFVKRIVYLIHEIVPDAKEKAEDYCLEAHFYGDFCTDALDQGLWLYMDDYLKKYNKEWQVDFLIEILCEDIKEEKHREIHKDEYEEIKAEVKWHLNKIK